MSSIWRVRQKVRRRLGLEEYRAVLGDANGVIYDDPVKRPGYVRVRYLTAAGLSLPPVVLCDSYVGPMAPGTPILLRYNSDGELCVTKPNVTGQIAAGFNPLYNNPADQTMTKHVETSAIVPLLCHPTSPVSMNVMVREFCYKRGKTANLFAGALVDLTAYVPAAGDQCLVLLSLKTDNTIEVTQSDDQSMIIPLDLTDVQEAVDDATAYSIPVWFWRLADGQTTVIDTDSRMDFRHFINIPEVIIEDGGTAPTVGSVALVAGTKVVNTAAVTANSLIFLTGTETGTLAGRLRVSARVAGTSFTILSSDAGDDAVIAWMIVEPS